jgi:hypothetical protein
MALKLIDERHVELLANANQVVSAWLLAAVLLTLLLTVVAPLLRA